MEDMALDAEDRPEARLDVVVGLPGAAVVYLDVAVVDAYSKSDALEEERRLHAGAAARHVEDRKRSKYHDGVGLLPFVLETHGRLGRRAAAWLEKVYAGQPDALRQLLAEQAAAVQGHTAAMVAAAAA